MRAVEFSPYLPPLECQKVATKILLSLILKPEQTKKLEKKLAKFWDEQQRLGQLTFIKAVWFFLRKGDQLLDTARGMSRSGKINNLYADQEIAFKGLKREVLGFGEDFANLILSLWMTKQTPGMRSFCKGRFSFWSELLRSYPEIKGLFKGPGASLVPKHPKEMSKVQPKSRRRKPVVKETVKV